MMKEKDRWIKNEKQMDKYRLKESEKSVTKKSRGERRNDRERGETWTKIERQRPSPSQWRDGEYDSES